MRLSENKKLEAILLPKVKVEHFVYTVRIYTLKNKIKVFDESFKLHKHIYLRTVYLPRLLQ